MTLLTAREYNGLKDRGIIAAATQRYNDFWDEWETVCETLLGSKKYMESRASRVRGFVESISERAMRHEYGSRTERTSDLIQIIFLMEREQDIATGETAKALEYAIEYLKDTKRVLLSK